VQTRHPAKKSDRDRAAPLALALPGAMSEAPGKDFLIFFQIFFARCRTAWALDKEFFIFFRIFFAECRIGEAPGKDFYFFI
jgi:hypothetical protein